MERTATTGDTQTYLLGTDPEEGRRLEAQHRVWSAETRDLWDRAGFGAGTSLLDLGCAVPGSPQSSWPGK